MHHKGPGALVMVFGAVRGQPGVGQAAPQQHDEVRGLGRVNARTQGALEHAAGLRKAKFDVAVRPQFDLPEYKGLTLKRPVKTCTDEDVEKEEQKRKRNSSFIGRKGKRATRRA